MQALINRPGRRVWRGRRQTFELSRFHGALSFELAGDHVLDDVDGAVAQLGHGHALAIERLYKRGRAREA